MGLDEDARSKCKTYAARLISVVASRKLVLCASLTASAFDSVDRDSLWRIMAVDGMLSKLIKAYYASTKIKVRESGGDSMPFEIRSGVRQGCALSPTLFNHIIDWTLGEDYKIYKITEGFRLEPTSTCPTTP